MQNLIENNKQRAILIASICASRLPNAGAWTGYTAQEGLNGVLVQDGLLRYARPGHDQNGEFAVLFFREPKLIDTETVDWGEERAVQQDVIERYKADINKIEGIEYEDTIEHTFTKAKTMAEAFKVGAEVAVKAWLKGGYAGVEGGAEVSAKLNTEYSRQWGTEETHTDRVERHIKLPADFAGQAIYEAVRSVDKMERTVTARSNLDYAISFVSSPLIPPENHPFIEANWDSIQQFIDVGNGQAAADKAMYGEFMANPLTNDEVDQVKQLGRQDINFTLSYDNVTHQDINIH